MHELQVNSKLRFLGNKFKEATNVQIVYVKRHIYPAESIMPTSSEQIKYEYSEQLIYFQRLSFSAFNEV